MGYNRHSLKSASSCFALVSLLWLLLLGYAGAETPSGPSSQTSAAFEPFSGILIDQSGYPVSNARFFAPEDSKWRGPQTDAEGKFKLKNLPANAKVIVAYSWRSSRLAVIPIDRKWTDDSIQYSRHSNGYLRRHRRKANQVCYSNDQEAAHLVQQRRQGDESCNLGH